MYDAKQGSYISIQVFCHIWIKIWQSMKLTWYSSIYSAFKGKQFRILEWTQELHTLCHPVWYRDELNHNWKTHRHVCVDKAPRFSIRRVIWILASDTVSVFVQLNQYSQILRRQCCLRLCHISGLFCYLWTCKYWFLSDPGPIIVYPCQ